jgi:hypothetical protein
LTCRETSQKAGFGVPAFNTNTRRRSVRRAENGTRIGAGFSLAQDQQATLADADDNWQETYEIDRTGIYIGDHPYAMNRNQCVAA